MKILFLPAFALALFLNTAYADSFSFTQNKFIEDHTKDFSKKISRLRQMKIKNGAECYV